MAAVEIPPTEARVARSTAPAVNQRICKELEFNVAYYARHPEQIDERLRELDQEWDIERVLELNAGILGFTGATLGRASGLLSLLPAIVTGFLIQHAVKGWCPPVPLFRRLGVRTTQEINQERFALKALRGDFQDVGPDGDVEARVRSALRAAAYATT